jgi:WD40-like Beta Propeller Repeat
MRTLLFILLASGWGILNAQNTPTPFLPEIFGQFPNVRDLAMISDGHEIYFTVESYKKEFAAILFIRKKGKKWTAPEVAPFSGQYRDLEPFVSPDGLSLYFVSTRPTENDTIKNDADIWYVKRSTHQSGWSEPIHLGAPVNTDKDEYYPAITSSGNLYFTRESDDPKRKEDIFVSPFKNGQYSEPAALSDSINSATYEFNAYVSPDEQFILFSSYGRADDAGGSDLYISQKNSQGEWTAAKNLGAAINSKKIDFCPFVDWKNNLLYFTSERNSVKLHFESKQNLESINQELNQYANGLSRIYQAPIHFKK